MQSMQHATPAPPAVAGGHAMATRREASLALLQLTLGIERVHSWAQCAANRHRDVQLILSHMLQVARQLRARAGMDQHGSKQVFQLHPPLECASKRRAAARWLASTSPAHWRECNTGVQDGSGALASQAMAGQAAAGQAHRGRQLSRHALERRHAVLDSGPLKRSRNVPHGTLAA